MGTLKKVAHADYSAVAVGKYNFEKNIFRRKVKGGLERNIANLNAGFLDGYAPIDLSNEYYTLRSSFVYAGHSGEQRVFSLADYLTQRANMLSFARTGSNLNVSFWMLVGTKALNVTIALGAAPAQSTDYECEWVIDYAKEKITSIRINEKTYAIPTAVSSTNDTAWTNGQTRTICCGQVANYLNGSLEARAYPYFGQLSDANNNILFHFDFLGDNETEILTDKARMITLQKSSAVLITSRPIEL